MEEATSSASEEMHAVWASYQISTQAGAPERVVWGQRRLTGHRPREVARGGHGVPVPACSPPCAT